MQMTRLARVRMEPQFAMNQVLANVPYNEYWHISHLVGRCEGFETFIEIWGESRPKLVDVKVTFGVE